MTLRSVKLYGFAAPLFLMPMLDFGFDQIIPYLKGVEFRSLMAEVLTQVLAGVADAFVTVVIQGIFS